MFNSCFKFMYEPEAMVRVLFFDMLSTYKQCHGLGTCRKTAGMKCDRSSFAEQLPHAWNHNTDIAAACYADYKFAILMDNQREEGYVTEKLYNGFLAPAVPIYFGAPDLARYVNPDALVVCHISDAKFQQLRDMWATNQSRPKMRKGMFKDEDVLAYGRSIGLEDDLRECVERVVAIDQSDELYIKMLTAPILPSAYDGSIVNTHYDGGALADGLYEVLKVLDSPLFDAKVVGPEDTSSSSFALPTHAGSSDTRESKLESADEAVSRGSDGHALKAHDERPRRHFISPEVMAQLKKELRQELRKEMSTNTFNAQLALSLFVAFAVGASWSSTMKACFFSSRSSRHDRGARAGTMS